MRRLHFSLAPAALGSLLLVGCGNSTEPAPEAVTTYHQDIAPLVADHCVKCHQAGGIAPFALTTFAEVKPHAKEIQYAVEQRIMPPSNVDVSGECQSFKGGNWLTDAEIARFGKWVSASTPEGTAPAKPIELPVPEHLGPGATMLTMAEDYTPQADPAHPDDDYRCFALDPGIDTDQFLTGFEIVPGQVAEVHHMLLYSLSDDASDAKAKELDDADPRPGWTCFGSGGVSNPNLLTVWAPGKNVVHYPTDTGVRVAAHHKLVMQIHYNLLAGVTPDKTSIKLEMTPSVKKEAVLAPVSDNKLSLAPGQKDATAGKEIPLVLLGVPEVELHGVFPHMHLLGRTERYEVRDTLGDPAEAQCLMDVHRWDFHWQELFFYDKPLILTKDQTVSVSCHYDTTAKKDAVTYGEGTQDEMCIVFSYLTLPQGGAIPH